MTDKNISKKQQQLMYYILKLSRNTKKNLISAVF